MRYALVLGGGAGVWSEVERALGLGEFHGVVAANDAGVYWPGNLDAWVSLHADKFRTWTARRSLRGYAPATETIGPEAGYRFPGQSTTGSSGLFALKVALERYDRAVLCGVPMSPEAAHFNNPASWRECRHYRDGWTQSLSHIRDRSRSMSGWTAELIGSPDAKWLQA